MTEMNDNAQFNRKVALKALLEHLLGQRNFLVNSLGDIEVLEAEHFRFCFTVTGDELGKMGKEGHDALRLLLDDATVDSSE